MSILSGHSPGDNEALELAENGLGFNNLLYMASLLAAITNAPAKKSIHGSAS
ncbi:MAG: hypothetical protein ACYDA3_12210 [Gaiellaceae bacterium]